MKRFLKWLGSTLFPEKPDPELGQSGIRPTPGVSLKSDSSGRPGNKDGTSPEKVDFSSELQGRIEDGGPGKNVLIRNKYIREDTGTHETLKIIDDSLTKDGDDEGFDPYNTGRFDRAKNWNTRVGK
jgi:hypothetical protein